MPSKKDEGSIFDRGSVSLNRWRNTYKEELEMVALKAKPTVRALLE